MAQNQLRRELGLSHTLVTVIGIVIGSGIFALPAAVFGAAKAPGLGLVAWLVGALVALFAALTLAELTALFPSAGGAYAYVKEAYGPMLGFLRGWTSLVAYDSGLIATVAMIFGAFAATLIPGLSGFETGIAATGVLLLTGLNLLGVRYGGWIQVTATVGKLVPIALLILFGLARMDVANLAPLLPAGTGAAGALAAAIPPVLFAYDGWQQAGLLAEEVKNPQRNLPLALIFGILTVGVVYTLLNVSLLGVMPIGQVTAEAKPVVTMAKELFGTFGGKLILVGMLVSIFGTLNGLIMTAPRYYFAMARDGLFPLPALFGRVDPKWGTPVAATLLSGLVALLFVLTGTFEQVLTLSMFVSWLFYTLMIVSVFTLRRSRPELKRTYRVPGYPVVPAIALVGAVWAIWATFLSGP
ncbi:MAG TPA: amino acid permease, partial [Symbiobacteriaceae bacterium]|nr:amino acid permease [Symbiobacteriaceae bacterium]